MTFAKPFPLLAAALLAALPITAPAAQAQSQAKTLAKAKVAITVDDLPAHGPMPAGTDRATTAARMVAAFKAVKAPPVYGMVNARPLEWEPSGAKALEIWLQAGNLLANHTFAHSDANQVSAEDFTTDIEKDEPLLQRLMGNKDWHYLRLPFLRMGDTPEKRAKIEAAMKGRGYTLADVSMGFNDYEFNEPYARCLAKGDTAAIAQLKTRWLAAAGLAVDQSREHAKTVFGHEIGYVYLLHFGAFDAVMMPDFLSLLQKKGLALSTLPDAQRDPAYTEYASFRTSWGGMLIERAAEAKGIRLAYPQTDTGAPLDRICR